MSSGLPFDDTPDLGSNYGLDGFEYDLDYEKGVEQSARLPEAGPLALTPDGLIDAQFSSSPQLGDDFVSQIQFASMPDTAVIDGASESDNLGDLSSFMKEGNVTSGPVDFSWLEAVQDPNRLPESPVDKALEGIMKSWGERTDGQTLHRVPALDLEDAKHEASLQQAPDLNPKLRQDDLVGIVQVAMRRSTNGESPKKIAKEIAERLADDPGSWRSIKSALKMVENEHGLSGNVFVRAMAYPGCHTGRWKKEVKKNASEAIYVIKGSKCAGCVQNLNGNCAVFNKKIAKEIPWTSALNHYARQAQLDGVKVAYTGDNEMDLRKLIGAKAERQPKLSDVRPTHTAVEKIDEGKALEALSKASAEPRHTVSKDKKRGIMKKVRAQVKRWHGTGLLTDRDVLALSQEKDPNTILRKATKIAKARSSGQSQTYQAPQFNQNTELPDSKGPIIRPQDIDFVLRWASQRMSEGAIGRDLDERLQKRFSPRVLAAANDKIALIRSKHEGLSGNVYIHAAAYANGKRDQGCAKGAARLRTSAIKYVLKMDRCKGCVRNHFGTCSRYNKKLVNKPPVKDIAAFQKAAFERAATKTASSNIYNRTGSKIASGEAKSAVDVNPVDEFNLFGRGLQAQDIQFGSPAPNPLTDDDISFEGGGIIL